MSDLLNFYEQQARSNFSQAPWVLQLQEESLADFIRLGFPNHHLEEWRYTKMDAFLQHLYAAPNKKITSNAPSSTSHKEVIPPILTQHLISIKNGAISGCEELVAILPKGVIVQPLSKALIEHEDKIKPYLNKILNEEHGFQALNTAMLSIGVFIYVPMDVCMALPIFLSHWQDISNQAVHLRHLVIMEQGSSLSLIEHYQGNSETCYFTNTITEIALAPSAQLTHYKCQQESPLAYHVGHIATQQATESQFSSHSFSLGGKWVRSDMNVDLQGIKATCLMNGIYVPTDNQHIDHHTRVAHQAPNCESIQNYKGILNGQSRAVFNGQIVVAKEAQKTQARQSNKNLLLSKNTEIDTKPQLEIFADDVVCTHGATVGQLDEDALFYFTARGIDRADAIRYLVQAFMIENLQLLTNVDIAAWIGALL